MSQSDSSNNGSGYDRTPEETGEPLRVGLVDLVDYRPLSKLVSLGPGHMRVEFPRNWHDKNNHNHLGKRDNGPRRRKPKDEES